ncbi:unnamed protein product, partial [Nesidiocoris tenuis]
IATNSCPVFGNRLNGSSLTSTPCLRQCLMSIHSECPGTQGGLPPAPSIGASVFGLSERTGLPATADLLESNAMDMSINAIYLHQMHHRTMHRRGMSSLGPSEPQRPPGGSLYSQERTPLLRPPSHLS